MLEPPPPVLEVETLQFPAHALIEQADLRVPTARPPTGRQFAFHQQSRRQLFDLPLFRVGVEGMLDDLAPVLDDVYPADVCAVAKISVRRDRETALRWSIGEIEVS